MPCDLDGGRGLPTETAALHGVCAGVEVGGDARHAHGAVVEFAGFRFDPERGLSFAGRTVHLAAKEMRGLALLLARDGRPVTRDEYVAAAWPRGIASDDSIARSIYLLRRALAGHSGTDILATVYGIGYRITAPVLAAAPCNTMVETPPTRDNRLRRAALETARVARELIGRRRPQDLDAAIGALQSALEIDPTYADASIEIAECRIEQAVRGHIAPRMAAGLASVAAERALGLDPRAAGAFAARGWLRGAIVHDIAAGLADIDKALALDPLLWQAHLHRAWLLCGLDAYDDALSAVRRALDLTPLHAAPNAMLGWLLYASERTDEAILHLGAAAERLGHSADVLRTLATVLAAIGRAEQAVAFARQANDADACPSRGACALAYALACAGNAEGARAIVRKSETGASIRLPRTDLAAVHLALGERVSAGVALAQAREEGCPRLVFAGRDPRLAALRDAGLLQTVLRPPGGNPPGPRAVTAILRRAHATKGPRETYPRPRSPGNPSAAPAPDRVRAHSTELAEERGSSSHER
jgi:DNA-binding winged helix-turn-helix (wHTH) protein